MIRTHSLPAENACKSLIGKPEVKRPFGRRRRRWDDDIKVASIEINVKVWNQFIWLRGDLL
jgi:hypothetical protein